MIKRWLLPALFCAVSSLTYAQSSGSNPYFLPTVTKKAPNTAAFEKFGSYEVNMFSGVPEISIPLYEIRSGELSMPITLSYHASGLKVSETASWAGLGWSLSAGGEISRNAMGLPDDGGTSSYLSGQIMNATGNNIDDRTYDGRIFMSAIKDRQKDTEPDIFNYSYPGGGGKFFLNGKNNNKPALIPFAPVKVAMTGAANSFAIADEKGNSYSFGTTVQSFGTYTYGTITGSGISSWPLEKIVSQTTKDTISLTYSSVSYNVYAEPTETLVVDDAITTRGGCAMGFTLNPGSSSFSQSGNWVSEQQLNTIFFKNGKAVFKLADAQRLDITGTNGPRGLKAIEIYRYNYASRAYELTRTIRFYQSYFIKGTDDGSVRLRLDSVGIADANGKVEQKYRFSYNPMMLPNRASNGKDWWGYYNGKDAQTSLIPRTTIDYIYGPTDWTPNGPNQITVGSNILDGREADPNFMQAAMLMRIQYPTGGYTDFNYETNRYLESGRIKYAGGLRIRSIRSYDGINGLPLVKVYQYNVARKNFDRANSMSGNTVGNYAFMTTQNLRYYPPGNGPTDLVCGQTYSGTMRRRTFVSSPTAELQPWDNVPVAYPVVTEYIGNGSVNSGKNVYTFTDYSDAPLTASMVGKPMYMSYFFRRGQLSSKSVYAAAGANQYRIVQREQMTYSAFPETSYEGVGLRIGRFNVNVLPDGYDAALPAGTTSLSHEDDGQFQVGFYSIVSDDNYLTSKKVTVYDQADTTRSQSDLTQYNYNNIVHQQVSKEVRTDSRGKTRVSAKTYAADFLPSGGTSTGQAVLDNMIGRNMMSVPVETREAVKNTPSSAELVTGSVLTKFKAGTSNAVLPDSIFKLRVQSPLNDFQQTQVASGNLIRDSRYQGMIAFNSYDAKNNITQFTPRNAGPSSVIWDYSNDLPVAEVKNAAFSAIAYTSFEANGNGNWTIAGSNRVSGGATGAKSYDLAGGAVSKTGLSAAASYVISYWTSNSGPFTIAGTQAGYPVKGSSANGWSMYQHLITGVTSVSIAGSGMIDELRLYPSTAQMSTYTYDASGAQTAIADAKGSASYYEYDPFQRLKTVRNHDGDIVRSSAYNYGTAIAAGLPPLQYYNFAVSRTVQRSNCTGNLVGETLDYVVEDGKYSSAVSQDAANQSAADDLTANAQNWVNTNGACLIPYYNELISRSYTKNNCGAGKPGGSITISVQPNTYMSTVSVADANQMANAYLDANGQDDANGGGSCPLGTDIASWTTSAYIDQQRDPTYHMLKVTVTRPNGDQANKNTITLRVVVSGKADYISTQYFTPGDLSKVFYLSFSTSLQGIYQSTSLDSIN